MIKIFFNSTFIYILGSLTRSISILLVPIYTRFFTPEEYGIIDVFTVLGSFISLTVALEISQAIARFYHEIIDDKERASYVSTALIFTCLVYMSYFLISFLCVDYLVVYFLNNTSYKSIFILASMAIATSGIFYFLQNQLKWQMQAKDYIYAGIIQLCINAVISIYLLTEKGMGLESVFWGQVFGNALGGLWSFYCARESYRLVFSLVQLKKMLSFSFPLVFSSMAIFIALYIDRILIKEILGLNALGIYGVAYRFASIVGIILAGMNSSLTPLIYKHYTEDSTPLNIAKIFNIFCLLALLIILGSLLFSKEIVVFFTTEKYHDAIILITPLIISLFFSNMYIFTPGLTLFKKTKLIAFISILSAFINTLISYIFIYFFSLYGIAIGGMISSIIIFIVYVNLSQKYYKIPFEWNRIILCILIMFSGGYFLQGLFIESNFFNMFLKIIYFFSISMIMGYLLLHHMFIKKLINH